MEFGDQLAETDRATFADMAKDWKNLESIVDSTDMKNVTLRMHELKIFDYLTSLELSFIYARIPSTSKRLIRTQALVQAIHNAPSLETLKFNDAALKILDVESIHSKATMLKHLEVKLVDLYHNDVADENLSIYQSAKSLEVFCLKWIRAAETDEILGGAIKHWPSYIGIKCPKLKKLFLTKGLSRNREDIIEEQESVARSLAGAFTNMQHLDGYSTNLYSILQSPIFDVIIANHIQLKHFGFLIDNDTSIEKIFTSIKAAHQLMSTVSLLELFCEIEVNPVLVSQNLIDVCLQLESLDYSKGYLQIFYQFTSSTFGHLSKSHNTRRTGVQGNDCR